MAERLTLSDHAREQVRERGLSTEVVMRVVQDPEQVVLQGTRQVAQRRVQSGGREYLLRVVYEEVEDQISVVTAYRTSKVSKYWREE